MLFVCQNQFNCVVRDKEGGVRDVGHTKDSGTNIMWKCTVSIFESHGGSHGGGCMWCVGGAKDNRLVGESGTSSCQSEPHDHGFWWIRSE